MENYQDALKKLEEIILNLNEETLEKLKNKVKELD